MFLILLCRAITWICFAPICSAAVQKCKKPTTYVDVRLFIIDYDNLISLNGLLRSLDKSDLKNYDHEVYIKENFAPACQKFSWNSSASLQLYFCCDFFRPDRSTGHIARDWNYGILSGFQDLSNPLARYVILLQADTLLEPSWCRVILDAFQQNHLLYASIGIGDQIQIMTAEGIRRIGIYDERFCNIGYQEGDYFTRCILHGGKNVSINDFAHRRLYNILPENITINVYKLTRTRNSIAHGLSLTHHNRTGSLYRHKWGIRASDWPENDTAVKAYLESSGNINLRSSKMYMTYPWFEDKIDPARFWK